MFDIIITYQDWHDEHKPTEITRPVSIMCLQSSMLTKNLLQRSQQNLFGNLSALINLGDWKLHLKSMLFCKLYIA